MAAHQAPLSRDSPGKNTGAGCHFLLQRMKVKSESEVAQSCLTLSNPMDCSLPSSSIHGIFQARVLEWGATQFLNWGVSPYVLYMSLCLKTAFLNILVCLPASFLKSWVIHPHSPIPSVGEFHCIMCTHTHTPGKSHSCNLSSMLHSTTIKY